MKPMTPLASSVILGLMLGAFTTGCAVQTPTSLPTSAMVGADKAEPQPQARALLEDRGYEVTKPSVKSLISARADSTWTGTGTFSTGTGSYDTGTGTGTRSGRRFRESYYPY